MPAELAQHEARGRTAAVLDEPLHAIQPDDDHGCGAGPGRMQCPCEAVEQREAGGKAGGGIDLGRGLRLGADHVEAAGDPLHLGAVAGHEGRLDRAPAAARGEHAVLDRLGAGAAHPRAVHGHHALAVLRVDQGLDRAAEQRVARNAGELGQERRCVDERSGRVVERNQRAHVAREQQETLLPRVEGDAFVVYSLQMALGRDHAGVIGGLRASLSAAGRPGSDTAPAP